MAKAKARILKLLLPLSTKLKSLTILRKNKVGPISTTKQKEILLVRESSLSFDRRHDEYVQARRAVLSSYSLVNGGDSLKQKMKNSLKRLCRDVGAAAVRTRVGVRVYKFTVAWPWSGGGGRVFAFRCFLPHIKVKDTKKPSLEYCLF